MLSNRMPNLTHSGPLISRLRGQVQAFGPRPEPHTFLVLLIAKVVSIAPIGPP